MASSATLSYGTPSHTLPSRPMCILEREKELERIISTLQHEYRRIAILGVGGIGKTTLALSVMHDERFSLLFEKRYFISCEGLSGAEMLWPKLADTIGFYKASRTGFQRALMDILPKHKTLLCLDGFEKLWDPEGSREKAELILKDLCSIPLLAVIITMTGSEPPRSVEWSNPPPFLLKPLSIKSLYKIVSEIVSVRQSIWLDKLLLLSGGIPLAAIMIAYSLKEGRESADELCYRWDTELTILVEERGDRNFLSALEISIKLLIDSPFLKANRNALALLALLSWLPDGVPTSELFLTELQKRLPEDILLHPSIAILHRVSLIINNEAGQRSRLRILSPVLRFCQKYLAVHPSLKESLAKFYLDLMAKNRNYNDPLLREIMLPEIHNIRHAIEDCYTSSMLISTLIVASVSFTRWSMHFGVGDTNIIQLAYKNCIVSSEDAADCCQCLGEIYVHQREFDSAEEAFFEAQGIYESHESALGEAQAYRSLGDVYRLVENLGKAEKALKKAQTLYNRAGSVLGESQSLRSQGKVLHRQEKIKEAVEAFLKAQTISKEGNYPLGEARATDQLARIYLESGQLEKARESFTCAQKLYQQENLALEEAATFSSLGDICSRLGKLEDAENAFQQAQILYHKENLALEEAAAFASLGDVCSRLGKSEDAENAFRQAQILYHKENLYADEASAFACLGELQLRRDQLDDALESFFNARSLYQRTKLISAEAHALRTLGGIHLRKDQFDEAGGAFAQAQLLYRKAKSVEGRAHTYLCMGGLYMIRDQMSKAEDAFKRAENLSTQFPVRSVVFEADVLQNFGVLNLRRNRLLDADTAFTKASLLHREENYIIGEARDLRGLGQVYLKRGDLQHATSVLYRSLFLFQQINDTPGMGDALQSLGELLFRGNDLVNSQIMLTRANELHTKAHVTHELSADLSILAEIYWKSGRLQDAQEAITRALKVCAETQAPYFERNARLVSQRIPNANMTFKFVPEVGAAR